MAHTIFTGTAINVEDGDDIQIPGANGWVAVNNVQNVRAYDGVVLFIGYWSHTGMRDTFMVGRDCPARILRSL